MEIKKVFVVGAGLMGGGIAQVCAQAGIHVTLNDVKEEALEKSLKSIRWSVGKFIEKGKVQEDLEQIMSRIESTVDYERVTEADLVIEGFIFSGPFP